MTDVNLDIIAAFQKIFGGHGDGFNPKLTPVSGDVPSNWVAFGGNGSPYYAKDLTLGTTYFMPVTFVFPTSAAGDGLLGASGETSANGLTTWNLPFPMISVSQKKTIIKTALTERNGTVKELITIDDLDIRIRGYLIAATDDYPENLVTTLRNLFEQNVAISIQCPLTDIFLLRTDRSGSDQVVITDLKLTEKKGIKNVVEYEVNLLSDQPFSLVDLS